MPRAAIGITIETLHRASGVRMQQLHRARSRWLAPALAGAALAASPGCVPGTIGEEGPGSGGAGGYSAWGSGGAGGSARGNITYDAASAEVAEAVAAMTVRFEPSGGSFQGTRAVSLAPPVPGMVVHYTVDGTQPTRASTVYRGPITLKETTIVRALAERPGGVDTAATAHVYLRLEADAVAFTSNLPIVVLHTHQAGALPVNEAPYRSGSISIAEPTPGLRASLLGAATLTRRAGLRVHGNSSRAFPQKSLGVELRQAGSDDDDEEASVLGMRPGSDYVLVAPSVMDRSLIRTALAFYLSNEIGQYAPHARLVEVFLTERNGPVTAGDYVGVFALVEKIKRGKDRVAVERLSEEAQQAPAITGGYIFRMDHDAKDFRVEHSMKDFSTPFTEFGFVYPEDTSFTRPERQAQRAYLQGYMQELFEALASPDFKHPRTGRHYSQYLDVPSFIDNNLLNALLKNVDAFRFSSYFSKDREKPIKAGPLWDIDRSSGTPYDDFGRAADPYEWAPLDVANPLTYHWWGRLFADPAFKAAHGHRFNELTGGPFATSHLYALVDQLAAQVGEAQQRHFARWPEMAPKDGSHAAEIKLLRDWLGARVAWMRTQFPP
jgi:hypothetical protein